MKKFYFVCCFKELMFHFHKIVFFVFQDAWRFINDNSLKTTYLQALSGI